MHCMYFLLLYNNALHKSRCFLNFIYEQLSLFICTIPTHARAFSTHPSNICILFLVSGTFQYNPALNTCTILTHARAFSTHPSNICILFPVSGTFQYNPMTFTTENTSSVKIKTARSKSGPLNLFPINYLFAIAACAAASLAIGTRKGEHET